VLGCALLLPVACSSDDDSGNPTPGTGGSGGKGGSSGKGGTSGKGGKGGTSGNAGANEGGATTGGSTSGGKGGSSAAGGKGGTGGKGGSPSTGGKGGSTGGTTAEAGTAGGSEAGSGGTTTMHDCTEDDKVQYNCGTNAHPAYIDCYSGCTPTKTDDSGFFLNLCPNEPATLGGVTSACQPWTTVLTKLGAGCTAKGPGCTLPALP
jgi:hypothetical protein